MHLTDIRKLQRALVSLIPRLRLDSFGMYGFLRECFWSRQLAR
jgi:hypothetical protein